MRPNILFVIIGVALLAAGCNKVTPTNSINNAPPLVNPKLFPPSTPTPEPTPQPLKTELPKLTPKSNCDSNYSGCVPIASDVDCAGGSGNGPAYVQGPIRVIGVDIYDLDRDGDGVACE